LENHLRPQFKKAIVHLVKMSSDFFWKQSNVYGLFGLDFMLDDKFNLWFIEGNPNPQLIATSEFLGELLNELLRSLFEIEYGLYRSRMKRVLNLIQQVQQSQSDFSNYKKEYQEASLNRFEPEYIPQPGNSFTLVMDESLPKSKAYFGNLDLKCV